MTQQEFLEQVEYALETEDWDYLAYLIMPDPDDNTEEIPWD